MVKRIIFGSVFIGMIFILILVNAEPTSLGKQKIEDITAKQGKACLIKFENGTCAALVSNSIVDLSNVVESDQTLIEQFLDRNVPQLNKKFGIETVVLLIDPDGKTDKSSSVLEIPFFAVFSGEKILDLTDLKASFYFITKEPATAITVEGDVEFYLDDNLIPNGKKKIFVSGNTLTNRTLQMSVADTAFGSFDRKDGFGFTFVDEIPNWADNTEHVFRVVLKKITGTASNEGEKPKILDWSGEHIAYDLKMNYDGTKLAKIEDGEVRLEFKSDSVISTCGMGGDTFGARLYQVGNGEVTQAVSSAPATSPNIEINKNSQLIKTIVGTNGNSGNSASSILGGSGGGGGNACNKFESLQRNSDYTFKINGKEYQYKTNPTQENLFIQCILGNPIISDAGGSSGHIYILNPPNKKICTSNFGYHEEIKIN